MAEETKVRKKVCILGTASNTINDTPFDDDSFEFWALAWRKDLQKFTRLFDLHPFTEERLTKRRVPERYVDYLASLKCPIYLQKEHPKISTSIKYPFTEVVKRFGEDLDPYHNGIYFSSSISYMIYFALLEKFEEIRFYGVDLIDTGEYSYQRPNTEYLIGLARGLGVKVFIPEKSALCKFSFVYGYEKAPEVGFVTDEMLGGRVNSYQEKMDTAMKAWYAADGARQEAAQLKLLLGHQMRGVMKNEPKPDEPAEPVESIKVVGGEPK
jgi:hypothetical protein